MIGYSSHGRWSSLGRIRGLELERGNRFPELEYPDETPAIWVCKTPREALRYLLTADEWDREVGEGELELVSEVDRPEHSLIVAVDGDGGYLVLDIPVQYRDA